MGEVENTALATPEIKALQNMSTLTREQIDLLKRTVAKDSTDDEFSLFLQYCKSTGLNPFARQIFAIKRKENLCIQTSIDGLRIIAERTGKYVGQTTTLWCGADGVWRDIWLESVPPTAAKVGILRKDFKEPIYSIALWKEFSQERNMIFWSKMPSHMLAKCAEALALRKAFPMELSGVYSQDELGESGDFLPQQPPPKKSLSINDEIPASILPPELCGRGITFFQLGENASAFTFATKTAGPQNGLYLLKYWAGNATHPAHSLAQQVLDVFSQATSPADGPTPQQ